MIPFTFFLRVDRGASVSGTGGSKLIQINPQQLFHPDHYYAWFVEANPIRQMIAAVGMVAVVLAGVMFPLWPVTLRVGVWYLSMGVLGLIGLFFAIAIFRLIFWVVTIVVAKPGIWIFPKLFDDVGFVRRSPSDLEPGSLLAGRLVHPAVGVGPPRQEGQGRAPEKGQEGGQELQGGLGGRHPAGRRGRAQDPGARRGRGVAIQQSGSLHVALPVAQKRGKRSQRYRACWSSKSIGREGARGVARCGGGLGGMRPVARKSQRGSGRAWAASKVASGIKT